MKRLLVAAGFFLLGVAGNGLWDSFASVIADAAAADKASAEVNVAKDDGAIVAELFTSQSCSSCPPAQALLGDLARRTDVVALELHVDYWDDLDTLFGGKWKDPWSSPVWSQRQSAYNQLILGSDRVYTPQMVVDGRLQETGSNRSGVSSLIEQAKALRHSHYKISAQVTPEGKTAVAVDGKANPRPLRVLLARIQREAETDVRGGENHGRHLTSHNIVRDMMLVGTWDGGKAEYKVSISSLKPGEGCAVLLQDPDNMHIMAGNLCMPPKL